MVLQCCIAAILGRFRMNISEEGLILRLQYKQFHKIIAWEEHLNSGKHAK